ncbi:MAG: hypothetical protein NTV97_08090 [Alphaproteobacteria bacterium]|nr:hypothetical protein [Alphaproteobacteria bacterium]
MAKIFITGAVLAGMTSALLSLPAQAYDVPADVRGQVDDMMKRSVLAPPVSPTAPCGTVVVGQEKNWAAQAPWKRVFSHHPSEWPWMRQYPAGTTMRFCQYTAPVVGIRPEVSYTAEVVTMSPTAAQLITWMSNACRVAIGITSASPTTFEHCVRGLYYGLPLSAPDDKKQVMGIRQFSGGQFVVAGAMTLESSRGGVVCHRDGVALLRERPGLPSIGYFVLTETPGGPALKQVNDGELAECFKIAAPKEWPGGSWAQPAGTTREQFWAALPKLDRAPSQFGLTAKSDLDPPEAWRRVVREAQIAALKSDRHVMIDAFVLAHASELLR